ncbi:hypothetical protein EVAR_20044_1 [Eumeta japonica]|uniref:Uncharacterized protein n=1 Tax=Eumeta variegata TaxID=151549 RepID=A0A4C1UIP4_EUMVA|nr:hypothetical protein EVAR_20044_1 [Eumeta japonica]
MSRGPARGGAVRAVRTDAECPLGGCGAGGGRDLSARLKIESTGGAGSRGPACRMPRRIPAPLFTLGSTHKNCIQCKKKPDKCESNSPTEGSVQICSEHGRFAVRFRAAADVKPQVTPLPLAAGAATMCMCNSVDRLIREGSMRRLRRKLK